MNVNSPEVKIFTLLKIFKAHHDSKKKIANPNNANLKQSHRINCQI